MPGKRVRFDDETWLALDVLARDRMMDFQELADEAFRDLLSKHNRPTDLKIGATPKRRGQCGGLAKQKAREAAPLARQGLASRKRLDFCSLFVLIGR